METIDKSSVESMTCTARIREMKASLRNAEEQAANYILLHHGEIINLTITELAEQAGVSEATVVRMCQKLGYKGFQELKIALALELVKPVQAIHEEIHEDDEVDQAVEKVFRGNVFAIENTLRVLSKGEMRKAVDALAGARKIEIYGVGGSAAVARDAAHKLMKTGIPCVAYDDPHMQIMSASLLGPGCVAIGISHSGSSKDIVEALNVARETGATTISISNYAKSPIDKVSDIKLATASKETSYRTEGTASRIAQLCIIDALFVGVGLKRTGDIVDNIQKTRRAVVIKHY
ncbi:MAG: MurR/RpiR family transcriptional regulator [Firmicutes bacterium]|jgi:DNA-binding MurR/RpiR family transcriptional regulator|nr:MurR/RpiR family transcriptional regulator [Bacillota bacterium]MDH7494751.1 MurR/RpiR family transcriptional regulator [Bacillota bacterium]